MNITKTREGASLFIAPEGRLDAATSPKLEQTLQVSLDGVTELVFDFRKLSYLSSAGLRVLLSAQKRMNRQGRMVVRNVNETVMDVFEVTGFADILTIE